MKKKTKHEYIIFPGGAISPEDLWEKFRPFPAQRRFFESKTDNLHIRPGGMGSGSKIFGPSVENGIKHGREILIQMRDCSGRRKTYPSDVFHEIERLRGLLNEGKFEGISDEVLGALNRELSGISNTLRMVMDDHPKAFMQIEMFRQQYSVVVDYATKEVIDAGKAAVHDLESELKEALGQTGEANEESNGDDTEVQSDDRDPGSEG